MPKQRPPRDVWERQRTQVWLRDQRRCRHCGDSVAFEKCHIDHIQSGKRGSNGIRNLRTLCRRCHVLRADHRHRGMISAALRDGIIPHNWRDLVWE